MDEYSSTGVWLTTLLKKNTDKFLFVVYGNKETHNLSICRELEYSFRNRTFLSRPHPQVPGISEKKKRGEMLRAKSGG